MTLRRRAGADISLKDLMDISAFADLSDSFFRLTGLATAILDLDGEVLTASGWQALCTEFHRKHPKTAARCHESDTVLANQLASGRMYNVYRCKNGLVDVAVPITIETTHVGNLFTGQFFLESPDIDFFIRQAEEFGFDQEKYLEAVREVPVLSMETVERAMAFFADLTKVITSAGIDRKHLYLLNQELERRVEKRTEQIELERTFSESLINSLPGIMYVIDQFGRFQRWNSNFETVTGYTATELGTVGPLDLFPDELEKQRVAQAIERVFTEGKASIEAGLLTAGNIVTPYFFTGYRLRQNDGNYLVGVGIDISDRVAAEQDREALISQLQASLSQVKQLSGFLPICASCKKIRDDQGYWNQIEAYIREHSEAEFSHSLCPDCAAQTYRELDKII